jgi:hypothetical protein
MTAEVCELHEFSTMRGSTEYDSMGSSAGCRAILCEKEMGYAGGLRTVQLGVTTLFCFSEDGWARRLLM